MPSLALKSKGLQACSMQHEIEQSHHVYLVRWHKSGVESLRKIVSRKIVFSLCVIKEQKKLKICNCKNVKSNAKAQQSKANIYAKKRKLVFCLGGHLPLHDWTKAAQLLTTSQCVTPINPSWLFIHKANAHTVITVLLYRLEQVPLCEELGINFNQTLVWFSRNRTYQAQWQNSVK